MPEREREKENIMQLYSLRRIVRSSTPISELFLVLVAVQKTCETQNI